MSWINIKPKINKWLYGRKLLVNYGYGWEYELFEDTWKGFQENKKAYQENCPYPQKWVSGRELNPEYEWVNDINKARREK